MADSIDGASMPSSAAEDSEAESSPVLATSTAVEPSPPASPNATALSDCPHELGGLDVTACAPPAPRTPRKRVSRSELKHNLVNRSFPISDAVLDSMWRRIEHMHPEAEALQAQIRGACNLAPAPPLRPPNMSGPLPSRLKLEAIQQYLSSLQYNHTGTQFFEIRKTRPLGRLMESAKDIIREGLPIKCLEATIVAIHLSMGLTDVQRFTISFKSSFQGHNYRHIVLGVHCNGKYGALGLSRRDTLMYKPIDFNSLSDLIAEYDSAYQQVWHRLERVRVSRPIPHDSHSVKPITWRAFVVLFRDMPWTEARKALDSFSKGIRSGAAVESDVRVVRNPRARARKNHAKVPGGAERALGSDQAQAQAKSDSDEDHSGGESDAQAAEQDSMAASDTRDVPEKYAIRI
eukprot:m.83900 g.83900  ORF g.83900 m.83900 type:complete len:404 (-) comp8321_c0_seq1:143-1354(-)